VGFRAGIEKLIDRPLVSPLQATFVGWLGYIPGFAVSGGRMYGKGAQSATELNVFTLRQPVRMAGIQAACAPVYVNWFILQDASNRPNIYSFVLALELNVATPSIVSAVVFGIIVPWTVGACVPPEVPVVVAVPPGVVVVTVKGTEADRSYPFTLTRFNTSRMRSKLESLGNNCGSSLGVCSFIT
jgi:hypothetical protein